MRMGERRLTSPGIMLIGFMTRLPALAAGGRRQDGPWCNVESVQCR